MAVDELAVSVFNSMWCAAIIGTNLLVVLMILSLKQLRSDAKYVIIFVLCIADFLQGTLVTPLLIHYSDRELIDYQTCRLLRALNGISEINIPLSCLAMVALNLNAIFKCCIGAYKGKLRIILTVALILMFIVIPIVLITVFMERHKDPVCDELFNYYDVKTVFVLSYWLPVLFIIATSIPALILIRRRNRQTNNIQSYDEGTESKQTTVDLLLATALTILLYFPEEVVNLVTLTSHNAQTIILVYNIVSLITLAKSFLVPLVWLVNKDLRTALTERWTRTQNRLLPAIDVETR